MCFTPAQIEWHCRSCGAKGAIEHMPISPSAPVRNLCNQLREDHRQRAPECDRTHLFAFFAKNQILEVFGPDPRKK